jgi:hypothetical protein
MLVRLVGCAVEGGLGAYSRADIDLILFEPQLVASGRPFHRSSRGRQVYWSKKTYKLEVPRAPEGIDRLMAPKVSLCGGCNSTFIQCLLRLSRRRRRG